MFKDKDSLANQVLDRRSLLGGALAAITVPWPVGAAPPKIEDSCDVYPMSGHQIAQLCNEVNDQLQATAVSFVQYNYRETIYEHSSVDPRRDPPAHIAKKIQHFWVLYSSPITCNLLGFSIRNGSVLKLAVEKNSRSFLLDVTRRWQVWLNGRDATGVTALDYVEAQLARFRGTANEPVMERYKGILTRAGAKRAQDLTSSDKPVDPHETEVRPLLRNWDRGCYFNEGLAAVKRHGLWGYVDASGRVVVPPRYDGAFAFSQGRAAVHRAGKWGYINASGNEVIPLEFADARVFSGGVAEVTRDGSRWSRIGLSGAGA